MTAIQWYILERPYGDSTTVVTIFDTWRFSLYQCYVDNILTAESTTPIFTTEIPINKKVDILGLEAVEIEYDGGLDPYGLDDAYGEYDADEYVSDIDEGGDFENFGDVLDDTHGDKAEFMLPAELVGISLRFYWDNGTGTINYVSPILDINTTGMTVFFSPGVTLDTLTIDQLFNLSLGDMNFLTTLGDNDSDADDLPTLSYPTLSLQEWVDLSLTDEAELALGEDAFARIIITGRLHTGTYKFGVKSYNPGQTSAPFEWTQIINTRPDEIIPKITSYDRVHDVLTIAVNRSDPGGTYNVYVGLWGSGPSSLDYLTPFATGDPNPLTLSGRRGSQTNNTLWLAVREVQNGNEEKNFNFFPFIIANGDWVGNYPAAPFDLAGGLTTSNRVVLTWQYAQNAVTPDGFYVYSDNGTGIVNYGSPILTIPYHHRLVSTATTSTITFATRYSVRAYRGSNISQNVDYITMLPASVAPVLVGAIGSGIATWRDF